MPAEVAVYNKKVGYIFGPAKDNRAPFPLGNLPDDSKDPDFVPTGAKAVLRIDGPEGHVVILHDRDGRLDVTVGQGNKTVPRRRHHRTGVRRESGRYIVGDATITVPVGQAELDITHRSSIPTLERDLSPEELVAYAKTLERRRQGKPVSQKHVEFMSLERFYAYATDWGPDPNIRVGLRIVGNPGDKVHVIMPPPEERTDSTRNSGTVIEKGQILEKGQKVKGIKVRSNYFAVEVSFPDALDRPAFYDRTDQVVDRLRAKIEERRSKAC